MATVQNIIERSLRLLGIRDFSDTDRQSEAIEALNTLLTSLRLEMHHSLILEDFTLVAGTSSYTIGTGGTIDTDRPIRILSCYIRDTSGNDHEVFTEMSKYDYDKIYDKDAQGRPQNLYYEKSNPLGIIYFDTAPTDAETCYIRSLKPYTVYTDLTDTLLLPLEYEKTLVYNLAIDLAPEYWLEPSAYVTQQAAQLKNDIENENLNPSPTAYLPNEILGLR